MLRRLYLAVSNLPSDEQETELPDDLTAEKMVTVVKAFFKASNNVIESVIQELLAKARCIHPLDPSPSPRCAHLLKPCAETSNEEVIWKVKFFAGGEQRDGPWGLFLRVG